MAELRQNTWQLDEWYAQAVAGNAGYNGEGQMVQLMIVVQGCSLVVMAELTIFLHMQDIQVRILQQKCMRLLTVVSLQMKLI